MDISNIDDDRFLEILSDLDELVEHLTRNNDGRMNNVYIVKLNITLLEFISYPSFRATWTHINPNWQTDVINLARQSLAMG